MFFIYTEVVRILEIAITMALPSSVISTGLLFFLLALARIHLSTCQVLKAKLSCLDCNPDYDFSGVKIVVKCGQVKKLATAITEENGSFKVELPKPNTAKTTTTTTTPTVPSNCLAKLVGGPNQLYGWKKNLVSNVVKAHELDSYTISTPLAFSTSCPLANSKLDAKCGAADPNQIGSSKTVDLPLPPEWGLAPSSYYVPFFPIIGIP